MRIYITHGSTQKDDSLKNTNKKAYPDKLYTSALAQGFMWRCKLKKVNWAILSSFYGIWFPNMKYKWYEKYPSSIVKRGIVKDSEKFNELLIDFDQKLHDFSEIWFYCNPKRLHSLYKELLHETSLKDKIKIFSQKDKII